ncbi:MAG: hypothetical protein LBP80_04870 [Treponema sp.]|jgi:hypothetical protein|nr:hypothetical protein [Treponema sp.]
MNFILIGVPDSGKSTLGKKAADALGMCFYDTDKVVTERVNSKHQGLSFFQLMSEFQPAEEAVVRDIAKKAKNAIIATGAETVLSANNVQTLRGAGRFIYQAGYGPDALRDTGKIYTQSGKAGSKRRERVVGTSIQGVYIRIREAGGFYPGK